MPLTVDKAKRTSGVKVLPIEFESGTLNIIYSRDKYSPKLERKMREMMDDALPANSLAKYVQGLVLDWDMYYWLDAADHIVSEAVATGVAEIEEFQALTIAEFSEEVIEDSAADDKTKISDVDETKSKKKKDNEADKTAIVNLSQERVETLHLSDDDIEVVEDYKPVPPYRRKKLPFNAENLAEFGITFITTIIEAIAEDQRPNRKTSDSTSDSF